MLNGPQNEIRIESNFHNDENDGFDLSLKTQFKSKIWSASLSWIAIDAGLTQNVNPGDYLVKTGNLKATNHNPQFRLHTGQGNRVFIVPQNFNPSFNNYPTISIFISGFHVSFSESNQQGQEQNEEDIEEQENVEEEQVFYDLRLSLEVGQKNPNGFNIRFNTWMDSKVWSLNASWFSFGQSSLNFPSPQIQQNFYDTVPVIISEPVSGIKKQKNDEEKSTITSEVKSKCKVCYDSLINTCLIPWY